MSDKKYTYPKDSLMTAEDYWEVFIEDVVQRENFKESHLQQLKVLCQIYVRYDTLSQWIDDNDYTYETMGQSGLQFKEHPNVGVWKKSLAEIRSYSRVLGLLLIKDKANKPAEESNPWKRK